MIRIYRCKTIEDAITVRKSYVSLPPETNEITVDLSPLDRAVPDALIIGVLLNLRTFFEHSAVVRLAQCPDYLERMLRICRREQLFVINDQCDTERVYH